MADVRASQQTLVASVTEVKSLLEKQLSGAEPAGASESAHGTAAHGGHQEYGKGAHGHVTTALHIHVAVRVCLKSSMALNEPLVIDYERPITRTMNAGIYSSGSGDVFGFLLLALWSVFIGSFKPRHLTKPMSP